MQYLYEESGKKMPDGSLNRRNGRFIMKRGRVLLVDEDELFRLWVRHMLEQEEDIEIVGDCTSAEEALSLVEALSPNIILMDTWLPGMDGIEACRQFTGNGRACDVIMLTASQELVNVALMAGATGYFPKDIKCEELATAIKLACKWQSVKAKCEANIYSARQTESIIMEELVQYAAEETYGKDKSGWLPPEGNGPASTSEVTLVIPSPGDAAQLQRFICQVAEVLQASILETVGSWSDTHITLRLQKPLPIADILDKLVKMPGVEEVKEETPVEAGRSGFFKKTQSMHRNRVSVTLGRRAQPLVITGEDKPISRTAKIAASGGRGSGKLTKRAEPGCLNPFRQ